MGTWLILILLSGFALYVAISIHRPMLIAATAFAFALGVFMLIMRILLAKRIQRETLRR